MNPIAIVPFVICIFFETFQQICYKQAKKIPEKKVLFISLGIALYLMLLLAWFYLLTILPLGVATPLMGASYITVTIASKIIFKERIDFLHWVGIMAIMIGLTLIYKS